jgi:hypothetical protein
MKNKIILLVLISVNISIIAHANSLSAYFPTKIDANTTLNNWQQNALKQNSRFNKDAEKEDSIKIPNNLPNIKEVKFGTNHFNFVWIPMGETQSISKFNNRITKFGFNPSIYFNKYFLKQTSLYFGLDLDIAAYSYSIEFDKNKYSFISSNYVSFNHQDLNAFFSIPLGIEHNILIKKRFSIEFSGDIFVSYGIINQSGRLYSHNIIEGENSIMVFEMTYHDLQNINIGTNINIAFSFETKRRNKLSIGFQMNTNFMPSYTINAKIIQPDKSYNNQSIIFQPTNLSFFWRYTLTGKRKRYLKR